MRLLPYIYSSFRFSYACGIPVTRALVMDYPDDPVTYEIDDQFMFGEFLMVAPSARGDSRLVYLPKGRWFDFHTGKLHEGGNRIGRLRKTILLRFLSKPGLRYQWDP